MELAKNVDPSQPHSSITASSRSLVAVSNVTSLEQASVLEKLPIIDSRFIPLYTNTQNGEYGDVKGFTSQHNIIYHRNISYKIIPKSSDSSSLPTPEFSNPDYIVFKESWAQIIQTLNINEVLECLRAAEILRPVAQSFEITSKGQGVFGKQNFTSLTDLLSLLKKKYPKRNWIDNILDSKNEELFKKYLIDNGLLEAKQAKMFVVLDTANSAFDSNLVGLSHSKDKIVDMLLARPGLVMAAIEARLGQAMFRITNIEQSADGHVLNSSGLELCFTGKEESKPTYLKVDLDKLNQIDPRVYEQMMRRFLKHEVPKVSQICVKSSKALENHLKQMKIGARVKELQAKITRINEKKIKEMSDRPITIDYFPFDNTVKDNDIRRLVREVFPLQVNSFGSLTIEPRTDRVVLKFHSYENNKVKNVEIVPSQTNNANLLENIDELISQIDLVWSLANDPTTYLNPEIIQSRLESYYRFEFSKDIKAELESAKDMVTTACLYSDYFHTLATPEHFLAYHEYITGGENRNVFYSQSFNKFCMLASRELGVIDSMKKNSLSIVFTKVLMYTLMGRVDLALDIINKSNYSPELTRLFVLFSSNLFDKLGDQIVLSSNRGQNGLVDALVGVDKMVDHGLPNNPRALATLDRKYRIVMEQNYLNKNNQILTS